MKVLRFGEFLNESRKLNEGGYWEGSNIFKWEPTPLTQEMKEAEIKKRGNRASAVSVYYDKDPSKKGIIAKIEAECQAFLKKGPFRGGYLSKLEYGGLEPDTIGTIREIIPFDEKSPSYLYGSFLGVLKGPSGNLEIEFSIRAKQGLLIEFDWSIDHAMNSFEDYIKLPKVQEFLKKVYLSIPDTREKDEILMNKSANSKRGDNYLSSYEIPKTFKNGIQEDPIIAAYADLNDYFSDDMIDIFKDLNKKYYQEWRKLNRKGIKGAFNDFRAWWIAEEEHIEFMNQLNEDQIPGGLADNVTIEDIAKKHSVSVGQIEDQIEKGKKVEMEHTDDESKAIEIAMDHLMEFPDYYDRLEKVEPQHESVNEAKEFKKGDKVRYTGRSSVFNDLDPKEIYEITDIVDNGKGEVSIVLYPAERTPYNTYKGGDVVHPKDLKLA